MKGWVKILLGVVVAIFLAIAAVFYFTAGMVDTAEAFFKAVKAQDIATARGFLAEDFKASTDERALKDFLSKGALLKFREASWANRQVSGGRGELDGSITTDTGGVVPIKMMFVKENEAWKIYAIRKPAAGLQADAASSGAPGRADQVALVKEAIHDFAVSAGKKDMGHFHATVSQKMKKQFTAEQFNQAYKALMELGANWAVLDNIEPILAPDAKMEENGVLVLTGHYPTKPNQVHFEQRFVYEGTAWKVIGFKIQTR